MVRNTIKLNFWPRSFRSGSRYSQKCSLFSQKRIKCSRVPSPLPNLQQFSTVCGPLGFKMHARLKFTANTTVINCAVRKKQYDDLFLLMTYDFQNIRAVTLYLWSNSFRCLREENPPTADRTRLQASDFESETIFADFCTDILSRIFLPVSWHIRHADFNGEHLSYLNKTNWPNMHSDQTYPNWRWGVMMFSKNMILTLMKYMGDAC